GQTLYTDQINNNNYQRLATEYFKQKQLGPAQEYAERAIEAWKESKNEFFLIQSKVLLADIYFAQKKEAKAINEVENICKYIEDSTSEQDTNLSALSDQEIAEICVNLGAWYLHHGLSKQAKEIAQRGLQLTIKAKKEDSSVNQQLRIILQAKD
ncbi:MAG: hypothetical protein K2X81_14345, partial [Candidatus Obscuribacterales bacterium]|nr:hypothetical protein [Candidatus Obscuribacterales bacterium]